MELKVDYKKIDKELYQTKKEPVILQVPSILYLSVEGKGNPNTSESYKEALELLYGLSYSIKMSKMGQKRIAGYFDYVVCPLEGLWSCEGGIFPEGAVIDKDKFAWTAMIRQPEFVTEEVLTWAKEELRKKKPALDFSRARLVNYEEGLCAQILHLGPYDEEPETIQRMESFIKSNGYVDDLSSSRCHHEIYFNDPRKTAPEKLKTIIRYPIRNA